MYVSFPLFFTFQDESTQYLETKTVNKTWPAIPLTVTKEDFGGQ